MYNNCHILNKFLISETKFFIINLIPVELLIITVSSPVFGKFLSNLD